MNADNRRMKRGAEGGARAGGPRPYGCLHNAQRALLRRVSNRNIVVKPDAQIDELPFELWRQRLERAGGAKCGSRRGVGRLLAGSPIQAEAFGGKTAIPIDAEKNRHNPLVTQIEGLRHHCHPILLQLREEPVDVTLKIHALGRSEDRNAVARLRAATSSSTATAAPPATGNCALRTVRAAARGVLDRIL